MRSKLWLAILLILSIALIWVLPGRFPAARIGGAAAADVNFPRAADPVAPGPTHGVTAAPPRGPKLALPIRFEPAPASVGSTAQFVGRGGGMTVLLTDDGMQFVGASRAGVAKRAAHITVRFSSAGSQATARRKVLAWKGTARLAGETNYFLGNDPARWRTHVPQFARATARAALLGIEVVAYGNEDRLEYDLRIAPGINPADLRLTFAGVDGERIDAGGDLLLRADGSAVRMHKPALYQLSGAVDGGYVLEADGTVGFRVGAYDRRETLVIDPSLSVGYATFLGGAGDDRAASIVLDAAGKIYIGGTTTSASFVESAGPSLGEVGGSSDYFIAKIDPTQAGPNSLVYLTFIGGSAAETGGEIAVDGAGNVALLGTTTSPDYPVTDGSVRTTGLGGVAVNDATITEIDPTGAKLVYSTLFGGNGNEATVANGGIAFDSSGNIFVAMDTQSTNLTTAPTAAPGPFQEIYGGGASDGFFAIFRPVVTAPTTHLKYCTYLGIDAQATLTSVAVDSVGNAYLAGYTSDPLGTFVVTNGFQPTFGGGMYNGFVMKILPSGTGIEDLSYGTFLGGSGTDEILAIAVNSNPLPGTVYVSGSAASANFPVNGTVAPFQSTLKGTNGNSNAFLAVIAQLTTGATKLTYSSYLGGSQSDAGLGIFFAAPNQVYIAGSAKSWDFPWADNFQPFTGDQDAFVAEMDPTSAGAASLIYATPLGGTAAAGASATAEASGITVSPAGNFYVAGATTAADFPVAGMPGNGIQSTCASCQENPPLGDAFFVEGVANSGGSTPSVSFNVGKVNFGTQTVGATNVPPAGVAVINTGGAPLTISAVNITGANAGDFSLIGPSACTGGPIAPGQKCSFEVGFVGSVVGPEEAYVTITDNTPATSQSLAAVGAGAGPFAMVAPGAVNFGEQPINTKTFAEITLTNSGNQPLSFTQTLSGPNSSQFIPASA
ncbi:MAG TPA: SBBP repeat-containing protein, partial [Candidatus Acidoferrales bacterium]